DNARCLLSQSVPRFELFCVFQQRLTDSVNFSRPWPDYVSGFGDEDNFWIGLELLSLITSLSNSTLRAELFDWSDAMFSAEYLGFVVKNASTQYTMDYAGFLSANSNVTGDSLSLCRGEKFSTMDRDNDNFGGSCSLIYHGAAGWWFRGCSNVNPNGWMTSGQVDNFPKAVHWYSVHGNKNSLKAVRLLVQLPTEGP
uniref:Fibrinogen C-terminal domain-containing protein n=1 Tax=Macrostomum lignano TaxID=282301 RepID=A0A1I8I6E3_9PLAT